VGWVKFRQVGNLHLYSSKVAAFFQYAFLVHCMLLPGLPTALFFLAAGISIVALCEALVFQLTRDQADEHAGSILIPAPRREAGAA
jgi:hypothetical protein